MLHYSSSIVTFDVCLKPLKLHEHAWNEDEITSRLAVWQPIWL